MNKRTGFALLLATAAIVVASLYAGFAYRGKQASFDPAALARYYSSHAAKAAQPLDPGVVKAGIASAAGYLRRFNQPSGQFVYVVNMNPGVEVIPSYSLLRHAGTIYSLVMANAVVPDDSTVQVMQRSTAFMRQCCLTRLDEVGAVGLWEPPAIMHVDGPPTYKLGGAGLALLAMASVESVRPGSVPMDEMQGLAALGLFLQSRSGEFHGSYVPSEGGKKPLQVMFYPGEMALGWLSLHELQPDPKLLQATIKALEYLARERAAEGAAPADHWALLATAKLFAIADREKVSIPRELLLNHALQICHQILDIGYVAPLLPEFEGAFTARGGVTPTAIRLEGLLAALTFLPLDHPVRPHVASAVHRGIDFLLRAQVKEGEFAGGMPFAIMALPDDGSPQAREFRKQQTEIRIDYVQHSLSALVQYLWWTSDAEAAPGSLR